MTTQIKSNIKRYLAVVLLIPVVYICSAAAYSFVTPPDLKGEWTFNAQKSKLGDSGFPINPLKLKITSATNGVTVERTSAGFNGGENRVTTELLSFDGKETESVLYQTSKKKSVTTWAEDTKQLTIKSSILFEQNGTSTEIKVTEVWKLSEDGKILLITYNSTSQYGTIAATFAYDKTN